MTKTIFRVILSGTLFVLTAALLLAANCLPTLFFSVYSDFSRRAVGFLADATAFVPFALWEVLLIAAVVWLLFTLVRALRRGRIIRWAAGLLLGVCTVLFLFVGLWGLNYYAPSMQSRLALPEKQYTPAELKEATAYFLARANELAGGVERDENGVMAAYDFDELAACAGEGYEALAARYDCFGGSTARVKHLLSDPIMAKSGTTGVFICLTGESGVSETTFSASVPFTMAHEIGHRMGFAREDEANFAGFLACDASTHAEFRYSGYLTAYIYCSNALGKVDPDGARELAASRSTAVATDLAAMTAHYAEQEDEKIVAAYSTVYEGYLKAFSVESGMQSYGEVADLLLTWYYEVEK